MDLVVGLEGIMLLDQTLYSGQGVSIVFTRQQMLLLSDPSLLLFHISSKLLVGEGLFQLLASIGSSSLQLFPVLAELSEALLNVLCHQIGLRHQFLADVLYGLDGWLVAGQLSLQPLVLLTQVLNASQVTAVVIRTNKQLLLPIMIKSQKS